MSTEPIPLGRRAVARSSVQSAAAATYDTEELLVADLSRALDRPAAPWGVVVTLREFDYRSGRTDLIALADEQRVIAFEAKLSRWREAIHQAFRSTFFAHQSFVVLPREAARAALRYSELLHVRRIGLCEIYDGVLKVILAAPLVEPVNPWLTARAAAMIRQANGNVRYEPGCDRAPDMRRAWFRV